MRQHLSHGLMVVCVVVCGLALSACGNLVSIQATGPTVEIARPLLTSTLQDVDGGFLGELHAEQDRDLVGIAEIPQVVRDAVIAVEDVRFYEHGGVDARAVARALATNVVQRDIRQGGSTITQQLVKNAVVGNERTIDRKLAEASIALQLEAELTKDQILERYLNTVYFGNGAYGVGAAARVYFDTEVSRMTLPQAALLAGQLRAPSHYDPYDRPDDAADRRNLVLDLMERHALATAEDAAAARVAPLGVVPRTINPDWIFPYVVDHALDELQNDPVFRVLGDTPSERAARLFGGGLVIQTTVDPGMQRDAEQAVHETLADPEDPRAAVAAIDPSNGEIRALVGGRDYFDPLDPVARFNLATDARRQPGSAFKPLVLAAALEDGATLEDTLPAPAQITVPLTPGDIGPQQTWTVRNAADHGYDDLTLRTATALSINTVYAQLIGQVGAEAVIDMAHRMGVTSDLAPLQSIALGAQELSPLEMATVTATIAAGGVRHDPTIIRRITDPDGVVIWEHQEIGQQVVDPDVTRQLTLALQDVVSSGTGVGADLGRPTAGKTGTSQDNADAWFTGFTPDLATAVWVGFPEGRIPMVPPRTRVTVQGGGWPTEIFARFGTAALADRVATPFDVGDADLITLTVDLTRDCLPNPYTPRNLIGDRGYVVGTQPDAPCTQPTGPPTVDVPVVEGLRIDQAREELNRAGFSVIEQPQYDATLPPGVVLSQDPAPGVGQVLSQTGYVATVTVASGDRTGTVVPDVSGRSVDVARQTLEQQGFAVRVRLECPEDDQGCTGSGESVGSVWQQSPQAGTEVAVHTEVVLFAYPS